MVVRLIAAYAAKPEPEIPRSRLVGLLEFLRGHDVLDEIDGDAARLMRQIENGTGPEAEPLARDGRAFLWIQALETAVLFAILQAGRPMAVRTISNRWLARFETTLEQARSLLRSDELGELILHAGAARPVGTR